MATHYAVATGNWNSTGTWSATSGGASGASFPTSADDVIFDGNSGSINVTINVASACLTLDCDPASNGPYTGTLTHSSGITLTIAGSGGVFRFSSGMTYTTTAANNRTVTFTGTSGSMALTSAGKTFSALIQNSPGMTLQLQDNLSVEALITVSTLTLTAGTFDGNGFAVSVGSFVSSNSNTRTLTLGNGLWTLSGNATIWTTAIATNLTFNQGTSVIVASHISSSARTFASNSALTFNQLTIDEVSASASFTFNTGCIFSTLIIPKGMTIILSTGGLTVTSPSWLGTKERPITIQNSPVSTIRTLTITSGQAILDYAIIQGITITGGTTPRYAGRHSIDLGDNTGWTFDSPITHEVIGITRNKDGEVLAACDVYLLKELPSGLLEYVSKGQSDGNGSYILDAYDGDANHLVIARKEGTPNVFDVTDFNLEPVAV